MRSIILLMRSSLDGFLAGPKGDMGWIKNSDEDYLASVAFNFTSSRSA